MEVKIQKKVTRWLAKNSFYVIPTHLIGDGIPDITALRSCRSMSVECKTDIKSEFQDGQIDNLVAIAKAGCHAIVITNGSNPERIADIMFGNPVYVYTIDGEDVWRIPFSKVPPQLKKATVSSLIKLSEKI